MQLIREVEIAYFRSFYRVTLYRCGDLNIIFGKNDVGKSNIVRALNLFFNQETDRGVEFNFDIDFNEKRLTESRESDGVRKFIYVKITFNTPKNYQKSLGESFYVKRQWTVSRGDDYVEEVSSTIRQNQRHIVTRFLNLIRFIYIPAIKDASIFESLLEDIYETIAESTEFTETVDQFAGRVQESTRDLFSDLPKEIAHETKISTPSRMNELFQTLDFETITEHGGRSKSLTLQRGDGVKVRHIPELLNFISKRDRFNYHIWGFEEPENSLDFIAAEAEASRLLRIAAGSEIQTFVTTHSPSFYNLPSERVVKYYIRKDEAGEAIVVQGRNLDRYDISTSIGEGFYLPAVAKALEQYSAQQSAVAEFKTELAKVQGELQSLKSPLVLTEGKTDEIILTTAWQKLRKGKPPFRIRSCDTSDGINGGSAGATKLGLSLKAVTSDSPHVVIGIFDRDEAGIREWKLDKNFIQTDLISGINAGRNNRAYGVLLPVPGFRRDCQENDNLPIEYLFPDDVLEERIDGIGLKLVPMTASRKIGEKIIKIPIEGGSAFKTIDDSTKKLFAELVVPKLPKESFAEFEVLFEIIEMIIAEVDQLIGRPEGEGVEILSRDKTLGKKAFE